MQQKTEKEFEALISLFKLYVMAKSIDHCARGKGELRARLARVTAINLVCYQITA
jgi:hypothetical protein